MPDIRSPLDEQLHALVLDHLARLSAYVPDQVRRAGGRDGYLTRLRDDPVFHIFGLDSSEYAAAALSGGTITSIHRKLGDIYEGCVRTVFMTGLGLTPDQVTYRATILSGTNEETRTADIYLPFDRLPAGARERATAYCTRELLSLTPNPRIDLVGVGMEVRHCYQTGDSKRTQADEAMARHLLASGILPVMPLFCNQSNPAVVRRYRSVWIVKEGAESYDLVREFSGYDLYDFLLRNRDDFRGPVIALLRSLSS